MFMTACACVSVCVGVWGGDCTVEGVCVSELEREIEIGE